jgi:hypothetical protein
VLAKSMLENCGITFFSCLIKLILTGYSTALN